ncbi:MAG: antibiotic biosynthesis monooxygenase [Bacteroidota bacterium]
MENNFTVAISHFVKPEKKQAFEQALKKVIAKAKEYSGHEGIETIQVNNAVENEYLLLVRFDNEVNYTTWAKSQTRKDWSRELKDYVLRESEVRFQEGLNRNESVETWVV